MNQSTEHSPTVTPIAHAVGSIEASMAHWLKQAHERRIALDAFLATQPNMKPCPTHPGVERLLSVEASERASSPSSGQVAAYEPCPLCVAEGKSQRRNEQLHRQGVLANMLHCNFDNWTPRTESDSKQLQDVRDFARQKRGFLFLLGGVGTGKSHLAVAAMRPFTDALFIKQSTLLRRLRATYADSKQSDPIEQCQQVNLLVIDDFGLSGGGKDEAPMLHEILDYRHGERKPTVITSNLSWVEFRAAIGERLADRMRESAASVLTFSGASHRPEAREQYFNP